MGNPWAAHNKPILDKTCVMIFFVSSSVNFGLDPPKGSKIQKSHYLKLGLGAPWAEHVIAKEERTIDSMFSVAPEENLGADPPTGSNQ